MIELRHLRAFLAVAEHGHFTRAAAALHLAQPALSQQIAQLEAELGARVFERSRRGARPTDAGLAFRVRAERVVAELEAARVEARDVEGLVRGRVVVGTISSLATLRLPTVLGRFRARHPGIELVLREEHSDTIAGWLSAGTVDLALLHAGSLRRRRQPFPYTDLAFAVLEEEELVLTLPRRHRLAGAGSVRFADLAAEPFVLYKEGSMLRQMMLAGSAAAGFTPRVALEASGNDTVRAFVSAGFGVALLPRSLAESVGPPIAIVTVTSPKIARIVSLAWRRHVPFRPAVAALKTFLTL